MNIKSASGFPTPNTVCVREQARCAHFVQAPTRSRTAVSKSALSRVCSRRPVGDVHASRMEAATGGACNRANAVRDARGARPFFSRILSSAAMTRSRAGCVMWQRSSRIQRATANDFGDAHACLQFLASRTGAELEIRRSKVATWPISATDKILKMRGGFANLPLDPATPVRRRVPF